MVQSPTTPRILQSLLRRCQARENPRWSPRCGFGRVAWILGRGDICFALWESLIYNNFADRRTRPGAVPKSVAQSMEHLQQAKGTSKSLYHFGGPIRNSSCASGLGGLFRRVNERACAEFKFEGSVRCMKRLNFPQSTDRRNLRRCAPSPGSTYA